MLSNCSKAKSPALRSSYSPDIRLKVGKLALQRLLLYREQSRIEFGLICSSGIKIAQRLGKSGLPGPS